LAQAADRALYDVEWGLQGIRSQALRGSAFTDESDAQGILFCVQQLEGILAGPVAQLVNYSMGARPPGQTETASKARDCEATETPDASLQELREAAARIPDRALPAALAALRSLKGEAKPDDDGGQQEREAIADQLRGLAATGDAVTARAAVAAIEALERDGQDDDTQDDAPAGPTVASVYAAWLVARGAERQAGTEAAGEAAAADAWSLALSAFPMPARERWEVGHKVEMLDWMLAPGTVDPHVRRAAFAGIMADLEG